MIRDLKREPELSLGFAVARSEEFIPYSFRDYLSASKFQRQAYFARMQPKLDVVDSSVLRSQSSSADQTTPTRSLEPPPKQSNTP